MDHLTKAETWEAAKIAFEEGEFGSMDQAVTWVRRVAKHARRLHDLYTKACSEPLTPADEQNTEFTELRIRADFTAHGLGLYLNGDPRGNPVGILTPKTRKHNTMGGAECGWRL